MERINLAGDHFGDCQTFSTATKSEAYVRCIYSFSFTDVGIRGLQNCLSRLSVAVRILDNPWKHPPRDYLPREKSSGRNPRGV